MKRLSDLRERGFHGALSDVDTECCWDDFFATEFCICMFLSQEKELNFPFCLLHYSHHIWQFGGMRLCFFMTLKFFFKSALCVWRPLPSLNILEGDPSQLSVQLGTGRRGLGSAK